MFNLYRHIRFASLLTLFLGMTLGNLGLMLFGLILMAAGTVGAVDLAERRLELLEKTLLTEKENTNEETDAH